MVGKRILLLLSVGLAIVIVTLDAFGQEKRNRQRIALHGLISRGVIGIPKWSCANGELGDLLVLRSAVHPGETIDVQASLFYRRIDDDGKPISRWSGVPVSDIGRECGYCSDSLRCAAVSVRFTNPDRVEVTRDFQLFLPYALPELPYGRYWFCHRIRVWANGVLVDDFYADDVVSGDFGPSRLARQGRSYCVATSGPCMETFALCGTKEETPMPQPTPYTPVPTVK